MPFLIQRLDDPSKFLLGPSLRPPLTSEWTERAAAYLFGTWDRAVVEVEWMWPRGGWLSVVRIVQVPEPGGYEYQPAEEQK